MSRGRKSAVLSSRDRRRLRQFQAEHSQRLGVSVGLPQLQLAMEAPFNWRTLRRAMDGEPVWTSYQEFIVAFLDRVVPLGPADRLIDYKSRASGEREEEDAQPIHRGSR